MKKRKYKFKNIRTKLMSSILFVSLIPIMILGIGSYEITKSKLTETFKASTTGTMEEIDREITTYIDSLDNVINMLSTNKALTNINVDANNKEAIAYLFKNIKDNNNSISSISMATASKNFCIYPNNNIDSDYDITLSPWYKSAIAQRGNIVYSDPYFSNNTGKTVISLSKTVDYIGSVIGVVCVEIDFERLSNNISLIELGNKGYIYITNTDGIMLAHPDSTQIGSKATTTSLIWEDIKSEKTNFKQYTYEGSEKYSFFSTNKKTKWLIIGTMDASELLDKIKSLQYIMIASIFVLTILSTLVAILISNSISKNIKKLKIAFDSAAIGNLTVSTDISSKDEFEELSNDFNIMITKISELVKHIHASSNRVFETSATLAETAENTANSLNEVSNSIEQISQGTVEQANNSLNSTTEMTILANNLDEISTITSDMNNLSLNTQDLSEKGISMVEILIDKTNDTYKVSKEVNDMIFDMNVSTKEISEISNTISDITERTNLLSLNASIEAARAGDAGKGFAVVANEIKNLAEQSQESTARIKKIIESIQKKFKLVVSAIETSNITASEQKTAVDETEAIFREIADSIYSLINYVSKTKLALDEINTKKITVLENIEETSSIAQETAAATEETNSATAKISNTMNNLTDYSNDLQKICLKLQEYISVFKYNK